jgi:hypothetical protein
MQISSEFKDFYITVFMSIIVSRTNLLMKIYCLVYNRDIDAQIFYLKKKLLYLALLLLELNFSNFGLIITMHFRIFLSHSLPVMSITAPLDVYRIMVSSSSEINSTKLFWTCTNKERMRDRCLWEPGNKRDKWERN